MSLGLAVPFTGDAPQAAVPPLVDRLDGNQRVAEGEVDRFRRARGPFVVAAESTRMAMVFTNALVADNPIIFANDSFLTLMGCASGQVVGHSFQSLMADATDPESLEKIVGQFATDTVETVEVKCWRPDGQVLLLAMRINPVHDRDGKVVQNCLSFVDLSAHEERMRQERSALHALYQHTPDFIVTMEGEDHRFTFANDSFQRLVGHRDLLGLGVSEAIPEFSEQGFSVLLHEVYRTGQSFTGSNMPIRLRPDGRGRDGVRFLDFIFQAVRSEAGTVTGVFCEGHDATEQIEAADQVRLLQAELSEVSLVSAVGTMAATIAHELNQPLTAISNYAGICRHLLGGTSANDPRLGSALEGIADGAKRAGEIIRRLRDMTEHRRPHHEAFDMGDAIRESLQLVRAGACGGTPIDYRGGGKLDLLGDRIQVEQVIMNLARNACEAAAERDGGQVVVSAASDQNQVTVSVFDNGPGVCPEMAGSLFEWTHSSKRSGMGIGLSICRQIVEAHHGRIWLESTSDAGTCMTFSLPRDAEAA